MRFPGGIRVKLTVALLAIVGGALVAVYLVVVPSLEQRLVEAKLRQLQHNADSAAAAFVSTDISDTTTARGLATAFDARVVLFQVYGSPPRLAVSADSADADPATLTRDPVALAAIEHGSSRGRVTRGDGEYAEVATQLFTGEILLLSGSVSDQLATVALIERRLLLASVLATAIAGLLGALAAGMHAHRIQRIERAAVRIAEGSFDEPLVDDGDDELGDLAATFDQMRVQLRRLDLARKEFVANASHELRTPLFSLAGFLELLADEDLDDATRAGFLATTREQVDRLTRLAANLLDLSRLDAGRFHVEHEDVDLSDVATAVVAELGPIGEASGHVVRAETNGQVWALADEERVLQVARAIAGNALAHTAPGAHVRVGARATDRGAELVIEDDGPGIPEEEAEHVFERFYRADPSTASGSGLGLAIARELVTRMDGHIELVSEPGSTRFTVVLPPAEPIA